MARPLTVASIETQAQAAAAFVKVGQNIGKILDGVIKEQAKGAVTVIVNEIAKVSDELVPVDTGELKASQVKSVQEEPGSVIGIVGYTAPHAIFVHEGIGQGKNKQRNEKFLERAGNIVGGNAKNLLANLGS